MMVIVAMLHLSGAPRESEVPGHQLKKAPLSLEIRKQLCDTTEIAYRRSNGKSSDKI